VTETFHECDACADFLLLTLHISIYGIRGYLCTLTWQKYSVVNLHKGCCRFVAFMLVRVLSALCIRLCATAIWTWALLCLSPARYPLCYRAPPFSVMRIIKNVHKIHVQQKQVLYNFANTTANIYTLMTIIVNARTHCYEKNASKRNFYQLH